YGDVAGIAGLGLVTRIHAIESNGEIVWEQAGGLIRPDDPAHPDYWEKTISTPVGTFYITWGRPDQPADTRLLNQVGTTHPAYRGQVRVVIKRYYFGENSTSVPNTRILLERTPYPSVGTWSHAADYTGESIVAGLLELATDPIYGIGLEASRFTSADWEALSAEVAADLGHFAPFLERAQPFRDVARDLLAYFDGWLRLRHGKLEPGRFPHNGTVPPGITELTAHDFTERPRVRSSAPSGVINEVVLVYRDRRDNLKKASVAESASDNVAARNVNEPRRVERLGIVEAGQARRMAAELAAAEAEGSWSIPGARVRRARAVWADGSPLQAGDNVSIDVGPARVDQVARITRRTDPFHGPVQLDLEAERGVYPLPYVAPPDPRPAIATYEPRPIQHQRFWEVPAALAESPLGISLAVLAQRPPAVSPDEGLEDSRVVGWYLHHSLENLTYTWLGRSFGWALRGTLVGAVDESTDQPTIELAWDAANLDNDAVVSQTLGQQLDDELLLLVDDELFSIGTVSAGPSSWTFAGTLRGRRGTRRAAHSAYRAGWLFFRRDLTVFRHGSWSEDETHYFKLQPFMWTGALDLAECYELAYTFRDRGPEAPAVVVGPSPANAIVGLAYDVTADITDVNSDLASYELVAERLDGPGGAVLERLEIAAGAVDPADREALSLSYPVVFPRVGTWRVRCTARDVAEASTTATGTEFVVGINVNGEWGEGLPGPTPAAAPVLVDTGAYLTADGATRAYMDFDIPDLPGGSTYLQAILIRTDPSEEWQVFTQLDNEGTARIHIPNLDPGQTYYVASQAYSISRRGPVTECAANPIVAGRDTVAPSSPTGVGLTAEGVVPYFEPTSTRLLYGCRVFWDESPAADLSHYEVKATYFDDPDSIVYTWKRPNMRTPVRVVETSVCLYSFTLVPGYVFVRAVDKTGNASAWVAAGNANAFATTGIGTIATQRKEDARLEGLRVAAPSASAPTLLRGQAMGSQVVDLVGGAASETFEIDLTGKGFTAKPDVAQITCVGGSYMTDLEARYDYDNPESSSVKIVVRVTEKHGYNVPSGTHRFAYHVMQTG
ncbi:MAG: hypothetical protein D6781_14295, partial [Verrucomicrobia bacterium]